MGDSAVDTWGRHRQALTLVSDDVGGAAFSRAVEWLCAGDVLRNFEFIEWHGLASLCEEQLSRTRALSQIPQTLAHQLLAARRNATAHYLAQSGVWAEVNAALDQNNVEYVILKGVATREEIYPDPAVRSAGDIDLLIRETDRNTVCRLFADLGFNETPASSSSVHEVTLRRGAVDIDLHWDILRPGRTRRPLVDALIGRRVRGPRAWRLDDADTVFMMLIHPAFTKYVCSRNMGLNRVVDMLRFVQSRDVDWQAVADRLTESGLCTAAWCTLRWIGLLRPAVVLAPDWFRRRIQPGPVRRTYLGQWLIHGWPDRLLGRADWLIQGAFTLPLHDRGTDAWRALRYRALPSQALPAASGAAT